MPCSMPCHAGSCENEVRRKKHAEFDRHFATMRDAMRREKKKQRNKKARILAVLLHDAMWKQNMKIQWPVFSLYTIDARCDAMRCRCDAKTKTRKHFWKKTNFDNHLIPHDERCDAMQRHATRKKKGKKKRKKKPHIFQDHNFIRYDTMRCDAHLANRRTLPPQPLFWRCLHRLGPG